MPVPPDLELRLRFGEDGRFNLGPARDLRLVSNEKITLDVVLEKTVPGSVPPGFTPVVVTGWTSRWISKLDVDDPDLPASNVKWDVSGTVVDGPNGRIRFVVPKASVNFAAQIGYSELVFLPGGVDPEIRAPLTYTLSKPVFTT